MSILLETTEGNLIIDLDYKNFQIEAYNFLKLCKSKFLKYQKIIHDDQCIGFGNPSLGFKDRSDGLVNETSINGLLVPNEGMELIPKLMTSTGLNMFEVNNSDILPKGSIGFKVIHQDRMNLIGSTIVITLIERNRISPEKHNDVIYFGSVIPECWDVLDKFNGKKSYEELRIIDSLSIFDPFPDPKGFKIFEVPLPTNDIKIPIDILKRHLDSSKLNVIKKDIENKELALEIIGDIPSSQLKPLENVLFICKLNILTKANDLAQIFSRFGKVLSAEVILDKETGRSLGYGFIEFDNKDSVELAYNKMEGVIIDDKKIHVDFSQSVSRLTNKWVLGH